MFEDLAKDSNIITVKDVAFDVEEVEDRQACTITVRVLSDTKWKKLIQKLLVSSAENEEFGVVVKQEYYLNEDSKPAFVWIIYLWGSLERAEECVTPLLNKRGGPPAPPASLGISAPVFTKKQATAPPRVKRDGSVVKEVSLPQKRKDISNKDQVINVRDHSVGRKGPRAYVTGYNGA